MTEHHHRRIIELLEQGQGLPLDYKHMLFPPERQEYELAYTGKEREEDILAETMAVPLQPVKTFGNGGEDERHNLFIFGDNLQAMILFSSSFARAITIRSYPVLMQRWVTTAMNEGC